MLQQWVERKAAERQAKRRDRLAHLEEEKFFASSHLQALEEALREKTYAAPAESESNSERDELCETLRTHLQLRRALRTRRPTTAQRLGLLEKANNAAHRQLQQDRSEPKFVANELTDVPPWLSSPQHLALTATNSDVLPPRVAGTDP